MRALKLSSRDEFYDEEDEESSPVVADRYYKTKKQFNNISVII